MTPADFTDFTDFSGFVDYRARAARLAKVQQQQQAYQIRRMVNDGLGWEDIVAELKVSREIARAAVFGRGK